AGELVAPIEYKGQEAALAQIGMPLRERRHRFPVEDELVGGKKIIPVDGLYADVIEQHAWAVAVDIRGLGVVAEQRGEVVPGQSLDGRLALLLRQSRQSYKCGEHIKVAGKRSVFLPARETGMDDQKGNMGVELVGERALAARAAVRARHFAVVRG